MLGRIEKNSSSLQKASGRSNFVKKKANNREIKHRVYGKREIQVEKFSK